MQLVDLALMTLGAWRLTDALMGDVVFAPLRSRLPAWPWGCARCVSVWAGAVAVGLWAMSPWLLAPLAISCGYLLVERLRGASAMIEIDQGADGAVAVRTRLSVADAAAIVHRALLTLRMQTRSE